MSIQATGINPSLAVTTPDAPQAASASQGTPLPQPPRTYYIIRGGAHVHVPFDALQMQQKELYLDDACWKGKIDIIDDIIRSCPEQIDKALRKPKLPPPSGTGRIEFISLNKIHL